MDINVTRFNCKEKLIIFKYLNNSANLRAIIWLSIDIVLFKYENIKHVYQK